MNKHPLAANKLMLLLLWTGTSALLILLDYRTRPSLQVPFFYIVPVALASWYNGARWGMVFAITLAFVRMVFYFVGGWNAPWSLVDSALNSIMRFFVFTPCVLVVADVAKRTRAMSDELQLLRGLLHICSNCKSIRNEKNEWVHLEAYATEHSLGLLTHGLCPVCAKLMYSDIKLGG